MKRFHLTNNYALINFDISKINTEVEIIQSGGFKRVLTAFVKQLYNTKHPLTLALPKINAQSILEVYKLLLIYEINELKGLKEAHLINNYQVLLYELTELLYDYWRNLERFGLIQLSKISHQHAKKLELITKSDSFNEKVLSLYRLVSQKLLGQNYSVYRQLPAGVNANLLYYNHTFSNNKDYECLQKIGFITGILTRPPFIINSKSNLREGLFKEIFQNPLKHLDINRLHYLCFPVKVGPLLAYVYIHRDFLHHGIALSNLFELAKINEFKNNKPDLIYIYGTKENEFNSTFYHDKEENIYIGIISRFDKNDYFGYLKKMLLTLHNVFMINQNKLPVHGAMASVLLSNNKIKNIVIIGDSGTGKSETLEALRILGKKYIKQMEIIFDDMGTLFMEDENIYAMGTEIGAFVRLDDLSSGYAFEKMDRAIFLNPSKKNARLVIPVNVYEKIIAKHEIDILLYANNYEFNQNGIKLFSSVDDALKVFKTGKRYAKGTTTEKGIATTFFANPFGPVQKKKQTTILLEQYFEKLFQNGVVVGEIFTKLAVNGYEVSGPKESAKLLLKYLEEK